MIPINLKIKNFFSHKESEVNFDDFDSAILIGNVDGDYDISNGSGKSAILEAILWCLFNKARTAVIDDVIKWGEDICEVSLTFEHKGEIYRVKRSRTRSTGLSGVDFHIAQNDDMWEDLSGATSGITNSNIVSVIKIDYKTFVNSAYFRQNDISEFAESDAGRKKEILKRIIDVSKWDEYEKQSKNKVRKIRSDRDAQLILSDGLEEYIDELDEMLGLLEKTKAAALLLSDERTKMTSTLEKLMERYSAIKQGLDTDKWDVLIEENKSLRKKIRELNSKLIRLEKSKKEYELKISKLEAQVEQYQAVIDGIVYNDNISSEIQKTEAEIARLKAEGTSSEERKLEIESLRVGPDIDECYTCGQKIDKEARKKIVSDNDDRLQQCADKIIYIKNRLAQERDNLAEHRGVEINNKKLTQAKEKIKAIGIESKALAGYLLEVNEDIKIKEADIKRASGQVEANDKVLDNLRNDDFKSITKEISKLKQRRSAINLELEDKNRKIGVLTQKIVEYKEKIEVMKQSRKKLGELERQLAICEKMAKMFGKNGIQTILLNAVIEDLEAESNEVLSEICNEPFIIMLETQRLGADGVSIVDTLDLKVKKDGVVHNFKSLSGGEQFRVSLALRIALSEISSRHGGSSLEFLLLDEINSPLDRHGTENLFVNVIKSLEKKYKILLITHNDLLKERFDNVIDVTKINGESFVRFIAK